MVHAICMAAFTLNTYGAVLGVQFGHFLKALDVSDQPAEQQQYGSLQIVVPVSVQKGAALQIRQNC